LSSPRPIIKVVTSDYMIQQKRLTTWDGIYNIEPTDWTIYELIVQHLTRYPDIKYVSQNNYIVQAARPKKSGRVNINTADQRELVSLPLIGPTLAKRIIEYRTRNGPFRSTADLRKVNGIGERQINRIKDLIEF
ncbi:MAG: ComEA family DNA-binding protein, partial [candidate division WOR-3 bacterium]